MKNIIFILGIFFIMLQMFSCSKDRITKKEQLNEYESINQYFDSKKQPEQEIIIDTNGQGPVIGQNGTKIWPNKSCLMYANGDSVYFPFTIKLVELYPPKDMIYWQKPTVSYNQLVNCVGEIRLRVYKNGQELYLRPGCGWMIEMPDNAPQPGRYVYYGAENNGIVNWVQSTSEQFNTTPTGYITYISRLGWIANGKPAITNPSTTYTQYTFTSTTDDLTNVAKFIYFPSLRSLVQVYNQPSINLPVGDTAKIVLIGRNSNNQLFYFYQKTIINSANQVQVSLSPITDVNLTNLLDTL